MNKIKDLMIALNKSYSLKKAVIFISILFFIILIVALRKTLFDNMAIVLKNERDYTIYFVPVSIVIGLIHAYNGNGEENSLYPFRILGPILASPLTCLTYAVVIQSSIALIYLVCYDQSTLQKYDSVDKTTLTYTLLLLITWSVQGTVKICGDCLKRKNQEREGEIISKPGTEEND